MKPGMTLSVFCSLFLLAALPGAAATLPKQVVLDVRLESGGSRLRLHGKSQPLTTRFGLEAKDFEPPASGEYTLVLHGASEDREVGRFTVNAEGSSQAKFSFNADWRAFLLDVQTLRLLDGENLVAEERAVGAAYLQVRATASVGEGSERRLYRLEGRVERRRDGRTRYRFIAMTERAQPGSLTYRLSGPSGFFDITVEVADNGNGRSRAEGTDDLLMAAMQWTELIVLAGETEVARAPLTCR